MTHRYELLGITVYVASAGDVAALRRLVEVVRADEREECAKVADAYAVKKMLLADHIEHGEVYGDEDDRRDADSGSAGARVAAYLIRQRRGS